MNWKRFGSSPAYFKPWRSNLPWLKALSDAEARHRAATSVDRTIHSRYTAGDLVARPATRMYSDAALKDGLWMVPDGDGWSKVYGDGDGWPVWDVESWAPSVSYGDGWAVPNGDGWVPYESPES